MRGLILAAMGWVLVSAQARAGARVVVEFGHVPRPAEIAQLASLPCVSRVSLFDSYPAPYFRRAYLAQLVGCTDQVGAARIRKLSSVRKVELAYPLQLSSEGAVPAAPAWVGEVGFDSQWGLLNVGQKVLHDIDDVHSQTLTGVAGTDIGWYSVRDQVDTLMKRDTVVAVLDSGLDLDHPAIQKTVYRNLAECGPDGKLPFKPTVDQDGNGYVGDCMGWNFTSDDPAGDPRTYDDLGHGTHVAGIVSKDPDNALGLRSISSRIRVMPVKVVYEGNADSTTTLGSITDRVAKGILYATKMKVDVINLSLGWPKSLNTDYLKAAIQAALDQGIVVVAAAGNNNHDDPGYPCAVAGVICVGSIDIDGRFSRFSNYGGQIDLLAPGDTILSLLPGSMTPMNSSVSGYDFKNGTSQAAPFVSAAAAVLRGIYPNAPAGEIAARLAESALAVASDPLKGAPAGLIRLDAAIQLGPRIDLLPGFKSLQEIRYDRLSKRFDADLPILSRWVAADQIHARLTLLGAAQRAIQLDQSDFSVTGSTQNIHLSGRVLDESQDSHLSLSVSLQAMRGGVIGFDRVFGGQVNLVRQLAPAERDSLAFRVLGGDPAQVASLQFSTVTDRFGKMPFPEYFLSRPIPKPADPGIEILLFRKSGPSFAAAPTSLVLPGATQLLRFEKIDADLDGKDDYLAVSVAQLSSPAAAGGGPDTPGKMFIEFSFFARDLSPLYGALSHWRYFPDVVPIDPNQLGFVRWGTPPGFTGPGQIGIPVFSALGFTPDADQNPDVWADKDTAQDPHAYYLLPSVADGVVTLKTRILDDYRFRRKVAARLQLQPREPIQIVTLLPQTAADFGRGEPQAILSAGQGELGKAYLFPVSLGDFALTPLDTQGVDLSVSTFYPYTLLDRQDRSVLASPAGAEAIGFYTDHRVVQSRLNGAIAASQTYTQADPEDPLFGYIRGFQLGGGEQYRFLESRYQLILWKEAADGSDQVFMRPIQRYSFLTGAVFNDLFFPVVSENGQHQLEPSMYIDATQIHGDQLSVVSLEGGELRARVGHSIVIPDGCRPLNPTRFGDSVLSYFSFACLEADGHVAFEYQPMSAP